MADTYLGSQLPMYQNVTVKCIDKRTGKTRIERTAKNRVTRLMLWGIAKFLAGEFNDSTPDKIYEYIPRYLAFGSNKASALDATTAVNTTVTVNDTRLLNEYKIHTATGATEPVKRINIEGRQHNKTNTNFSDSFVKLSLNTYVSSSKYNGMEIGEAGLFSKEQGDNCLARVVFPAFQKKEGEVIDIQWDITLLSYGTTKYPNSVSINGPAKVVIPLHYSPYHIKHVRTGMFYNQDTGMILDADNNFLFTVADNGDVEEFMNITDAKKEKWAQYIEQLNDEHLTIDSIFAMMLNNKISSSQFYYNSGTNENMPSHFYLGNAVRIPGSENLLADSDNFLLHDKDGYQLVTNDPIAGSSTAREIYMSYIYKEDRKYTEETTGARIDLSSGTNGNYTVVDSNGDDTAYTLKNYQFFKKDSNGEYVECDAYINNGYILNKDKVTLGYVYKDTGDIFKQTEVTPVEDNCTEAYITYHDSNETQLDIYKFAGSGKVVNTEYYYITPNNEVFKEGIDTEYHITNDYYFAIGETDKLSVSILPVDATDTSVTWSIANDLIAQITQQGILTGWNIGQTLVTATTTNGVKSRVTVEVVRDTALVVVDSVILDPDTITLNVKNDANKEIIIKATVLPAIASYSSINWSSDSNFDNMLKFEDIGNNEVKIKLNGSENIGRGYITASVQDGKSASCLVTVMYEDSSIPDCPDDSHNMDRS